MMLWVFYLNNDWERLFVFTFLGEAIVLRFHKDTSWEFLIQEDFCYSFLLCWFGDWRLSRLSLLHGWFISLSILCVFIDIYT